jgi:type VI secretion system protein VasJ
MVKLVSNWVKQYQPTGAEAQPSAQAPAATAPVQEQAQEAPPEEAKPKEMSDFVKQLIAPIPGDNPCGEDPKYLHEFEIVKEEIEKSGGTDYELVAGNCHIILTKQAKDLRVLGFYMLAASKTEGLVQVCDLITAYKELLSKYLEEIHPVRETAKINAVKWLNQDKLNMFLSQLNVNTSNHEDAKAAQSALQEIKNLVNNRFKESPPSIGVLVKLVDKWVKESKPMPVQPAPQQPAAGAAPGVAAAAPSAAGAPAGLPSASQDVADKSSAQILLQKTAQFYIKNIPDNPIGYKIMRIIKWREIIKMPNAPEGKLKIPGPNPQMAAHYAQLIQEQNWQGMLAKGEDAFTRPGFHFWFDLQYYMYKAMEGLGGSYAACGEAILEELLSLVERVPGLVNLQYQDGTPFANAVTGDWIQEKASERKAGGGPGGGGPQDPKLQEDKKAALELAGKGKIEEALALLEKGNSGFSAKTSAERKLVMANLCFQSKNAIIAEGILDGLMARIEAGSLADWDTGFCITVYELGIKTCRSLAEQKSLPEEEKNRYLMKARDCFKKLSKIDPVRAVGMKF